HWHARGGRLDLAGVGQGHARLQPLKARTAVLVEGHDLAVDDEVLHRQGEEDPGEIGIAARDELPAAPIQLDGLPPPPREHTHTLELDLEKPASIRRRTIVEGGEHEGLAARRHLASRRLESVHTVADGREMRRHIRDLLYGETREDRLRVPIDELLARRAAVGLLEEEPLRL